MLHGFQFALKMMQKRPLRMGLTLLQIAVGVASITIVLSFVFSVLGDINSNETEQVWEVKFGKEEVRDGRTMGGSYTSFFTDKMVERIKEESIYIEEVSILEQNYGGELDYEGVRYNYFGMYGVDIGYKNMVGVKMLEGQFISQSDVNSRNPVIVISEEVSQQLFGDESGIGKIINLSPDRHFDVIGICSIEKQFGWNPAHFFIPQSVLAFGEKQEYGTIWIKCNKDKVTEMKNELSILLANEIENSMEKDMGLIFNELSETGKEMRQGIAKIFGLFIGSFAFIALVVSSIGILSMMMVSIIERTREIGLRRAIGASRLSIMGQILSESVFISFVGGLFGIILATLSVKPIINELIIKGLFQQFIGLEANISLYPILISLGSIVFVGLITGLYPGIRASRLAPVDAIREG